MLPVRSRAYIMRQPICIWLAGLTLRGSKVAARLLSQHLNDKGRPGFSSKTEAKDQMEEIELCAPSSFGLALKTNYSTTDLIFLSLLCLDLLYIGLLPVSQNIFDQISNPNTVSPNIHKIGGQIDALQHTWPIRHWLTNKCYLSLYF